MPVSKEGPIWCFLSNWNDYIKIAIAFPYFSKSLRLHHHFFLFVHFVIIHLRHSPIKSGDFMVQCGVLKWQGILCCLLKLRLFYWSPIMPIHAEMWWLPLEKLFLLLSYQCRWPLCLSLIQSVSQCAISSVPNYWQYCRSLLFSWQWALHALLVITRRLWSNESGCWTLFQGTFTSSPNCERLTDILTDGATYDLCAMLSHMPWSLLIFGGQF